MLERAASKHGLKTAASKSQREAKMAEQDEELQQLLAQVRTGVGGAGLSLCGHQRLRWCCSYRIPNARARRSWPSAAWTLCRSWGTTSTSAPRRRRSRPS